ncbi:MAG TPA: hypothetical protein EYH23_00975 [Euryarchaeota archaeon]|nr:hypothetical protein [Euryarchaeota archaeon]
MRVVLGRLRRSLGRAAYKGYERLLDVRNQIRDRLFGKPDIIVVGENHYDMSHAHTIARLIRKYKPEYLLLEGFSNRTREELEDLVKRYKVRTLEELCKHYGVPLEKLGINDGIVYEINESAGIAFLKKMRHYMYVLGKRRGEAAKLARDDLRVEGHVPKNMDELMKTPLYFLHPVALEVLREKIADGWCRYGGVHDGERVLKLLEHIRSYMRTGSEDDVIKVRRYDVMLSAAADVGAKVAGCDVRKPDLAKIGKQGVSESLIKEFSPHCRPVVRWIIRKYTLSTENFGENHPKYNEFITELCRALRPVRDHTMCQNALEYAWSRTSGAPVMMVVGRAHVPGIHKRLKKWSVKHRVIKLPSFATGTTTDCFRG